MWVPNTGRPAITAFDRYYYAQQDRKGAVIDERFNGGGLLDDYMVSVMSRQPVGGVTDFVPGAKNLRLPASGILGPKVLVTNELAGSGGDFFPWVFRQMKVGPLIGSRTWGGLVNAAVPYPLVDGGSITAPALAVFGLVITSVMSTATQQSGQADPIMTAQFEVSARYFWPQLAHSRWVTKFMSWIQRSVFHRVKGFTFRPQGSCNIATVCLFYLAQSATVGVGSLAST